MRPDVALAVSVLATGLLVSLLTVLVFLATFAAFNGEWAVSILHLLGAMLCTGGFCVTSTVVLCSLCRIFFEALFKGVAKGLAGNK